MQKCSTWLGIIHFHSGRSNAKISAVAKRKIKRGRGLLFWLSHIFSISSLGCAIMMDFKDTSQFLITSSHKTFCIFEKDAELSK